ncbi:MAG: 1-acyl-sn-glycerol-3-phosphate acyltransferase [Clostridia bacterium]|nr:1-acyl-sn-glycerol-3-phosphate acyltransferase [Clostridia bacterium]
MKIKIKEKSYEEVLALPAHAHKKPLKQNLFWRTLLRAVSTPDLLATRFKCKEIGMERLGKREPALFLMNHSSFIDLKIASTVLFPRPFNIVCTTDGFVGKNLLMRLLGCIPTNKFVSDLNLVRDMVYATKKLKSSVLMYPEAGYSFDGTATRLPDSLGKCVKLLGVPVVVIRTYGAFARDPLYNNLQTRRVRVSAEMEYLLSPDEIKELSAAEIAEKISAQFAFDSFRWQQENKVKIDEPFRADCLNRVLYKCPHCMSEGNMEGRGTKLTCHACGSSWELDEYGYLAATKGETRFTHVPDWYEWERACVREELLKNEYLLDLDVDIYLLTDTKCLYRVGEGHLTHSRAGFHLTGCDGKLEYTQDPSLSYTLNSDFNWYEIGDVISIGNNRMLYYCFPKQRGDFAAKARLATEELYGIVREERKNTHKEALASKK